MLQSDAPFLSEINGGSQVRTAAVKLQNMASVAWSAGYHNQIQRDELTAFWTDQKARVKLANGQPHDGVFMSLVIPDIRRLCYKVLSYIRLYGNNAANIKKWEDFCDYFIMAADSLRDTRSAVTQVVVEPIYETGQPFFTTDPARAIFRVTLKDAAGKLIPISADNPALGTLDILYVNEGTPANINKWRGEKWQVITNPCVIDHGRFTSPPSTLVNGAATCKVKYTADVEPAIEGSCTYNRGKVPPVVEASLTIAPTTLVGNIGNAGTLKPTVLPTNAADKTVTWTTSAPAVATVAANGVVTYVAAGTATITGKTKNGKTATVAVTVNAAPPAKNGVEE